MFVRRIYRQLTPLQRGQGHSEEMGRPVRSRDVGVHSRDVGVQDEHGHVQRGTNRQDQTDHQSAHDRGAGRVSDHRPKRQRTSGVEGGRDQRVVCRTRRLYRRGSR